MIRWIAGRGRAVAVHLGLAVLVYVPLLLTQPGWVGADTKTYLYLDPGRLLRKAPYMWDPSVGMGTVTHQTIGYLFPMGPYYWAMEQLGLPDWVAQRLWLATILFAAGAGVLFLARTLAWRGAGPVVAALVYMLSPYPLATAARISVILLPWAALPWMIGIVVRALRRGGWRWPAAFALVVALVGGVNATALLYAGVGPVLWFPFAVWVTREVSLRDALATIGRIGVLTVAVSLWWIVALSVQGRYGLPVLAFSETFDTAAATSIPSEVLRGLGYWFFYGSDKLGPWIEPSVRYTEVLWLLAVSFLLPLLAFTAAAWTRWRHRAYFVALVVVGTVLGVGSYPFDDSSPLGGLFKEFATGSTAGLALRSHARAVPLVVLGTAVLLGLGITALGRRIPPAGLAAACLVGILAVANLPPLWQGELVDRNLRRPEDIPDYWEEATAYLDGRGDGTRVLEIPGSDFASYRWGNTVDAISPGLMDRPMVARELIPFGSPPSTDLLIALDRRLQEGLFEPDALAPMARLMAAGDILLRSDLQYERYRTARPQRLWNELTPLPAGLQRAASFGDPVPNEAVPRLPLLDEITLGLPPDSDPPAPVEVITVRNPRPIVRAETAARPLLVAGDGEGLVEAAAAGMLAGRGVILYGAALAGGDEGDAGIDRALDHGADLLLTDSNRKRARRWRTVRENFGYTERVDEPRIADDLSDARLEVFPDAPASSFTVAEHRGGAGVSASGYGNPVSYTPNDRPVLAMDGDPRTAWRVGAMGEVIGERLVVDLDRPLTTGEITLLQPIDGVRNRWITSAAVRFDDGSSIDVALDERSRSEPGQVVTFEPRTFSRVEIEITGDNVGDLPRWEGISGVGLAEVGLGDPPIRVEEVIRPPTHVLDAAASDFLDHRLSVLFARQRSDPAEPVRTDAEPTIVRAFDLPEGRSFSVAGTARLSAYVADDVVDALVGGADGVTARSSGRLPGSLAHRAVATIDGDAATAWSPPFLDQVGHWLEYETDRPMTFDTLDLQLVADGRHSVPTRLRIEPEGGDPVSVGLPVVSDSDEPGATVAVPVTLPTPITAERVRITVEAVREVRTTDWYSLSEIVMPVAVAEIGIPGLVAAPPPEQLPDVCRDDLLSIDGASVALRVVGTTRAALDRDGLTLEPCEPGTAIELASGDHVLRTGLGRDLGIDVDRLVLVSERGGDALPLGASTGAPSRGPRPVVEVVDQGPAGAEVRVDNPGEPFWLVLGQSHNAGWHASLEGTSLGEAQLVDGYANGWYVEPPDRAGPLSFSISWRPQRLVWGGLAASGAALLVCLALVILDPRRRPPRERPEPVWVFPSMPTEPELGSPVLGPGRTPSTPAVVAGTVAVAVVTALVADPLLAVPAAGATLASLVTRRGRALLTVGAVGAFALAALYVVVQQARHGYPADFTWPENFRRINLVAWVAVVLLGADALVERLRARPPVSRSRRRNRGER